MDFTREPIVETIITPREGFRLVIRSSKNPGQEEFAVDSLEVVSFGSICFYRHLERPRSFIVPASDYEVLEIREARMPLKAASFEGIVKPSGAKEPHRAQPKELKSYPPKEISAPEQDEDLSERPAEEEMEEAPSSQAEVRHDRRKERKRGGRRRRSPREEGEENRPQERSPSAQVVEVPPQIAVPVVKEPVIPSTTVLPPPSTLIRDDLDRLRKSDQYRGAFYSREAGSFSKEEPLLKEEEEEDIPVVPAHLKEEEPSAPPEEESVYKATPLPPEEEDVRSPLWTGGGALGGDKP